MLKIEKFVLGPLETNAYLVMTDDGTRGIVIDPGMDAKHLLDRIRDVQIEAVLLTHAHFDHIGGVEAVRKAKQCPVYVHELERDWLTTPELNGSLLWPEIGGEIRASGADHLMRDGDELHFLGETFQVLHTPGHSPGSVSLLLAEHRLVFSGDVLFRMSVGRTDLPGGSSRELYASIHNKLFRLQAETTVLPGHGPLTTIGEEMEHNPYV
jgi:glyoxylase-like metal-dependent hydrolase (beta-lactamase superfamily II)